MKRFVASFLLIFLFKAFVFGQIDLRNFNYYRADSAALNFPKMKYTCTGEIVGPLTRGLETDHEKFRAIFRWITDNIQYSFSNRTTDPNKIIKKGKCVCAGYSSLLRDMCSRAGIECVYVTGYSKTKVYSINRKFNRSNHAWNAVHLYGKWYLADATWAAGTMDPKNGKFVKDYDDSYFLTDPAQFFKTHYPEKKDTFFQEKFIRKRAFVKAPLYYSGIIEYNVKDLLPRKGEIRTRLNDSLEIRIKSEKPIMRFRIILRSSKYAFRPAVTEEDGYYVLKQKFLQPCTTQMTIMADDSAIATYKLSIK